MDVVIRPAVPADRAALGRALSRIWGGYDYIPRLFDDWVRDGGFFVARLGRRIVGCGKVTELGPGELWLEGLRVDPRLHGRGLGAEVSRQVIYAALDRRPRSLRFATADRNHASLSIARHQPFCRLAALRAYAGSPPPSAAGPEPVIPDIGEALDFLTGSEELHLTHGLLRNGWVFRRLDRRYLAELVRSGTAHNGPLVRGVRRAGRLDGLLVLHTVPREDPGLDVSFLGGSARAQAVLCGYIGRVARARRSRSVSGMAAGAQLAAALARLGLRPLRRHFRYQLLFEYNL